jgi:hypothetical protein
MESNDPQYTTPEGSALRIWRDSARNNYLSEQHGRPIFDEVVYVEDITPGFSGSIPVFEVKRVLAPEAETSEPMYGMQYERYKSYIKDFESGTDIDNKLTGTPLKEWPEISRSLAASLNASKIFSVEALAEISDTRLSAIGPDGRSWREKAKAWLAVAKDASYATKIAADLEHMRNDLTARDTEIKRLSAQIEALQAAGGKPVKVSAKSEAATVIDDII